MPALQLPDKSFLTVSEMCEACQISRSHWYDLVAAGVFPPPVRHPSSKRPMYDRALIEKCLEIRQTGVGANGLPVLWNRKSKKNSPPKAQRKPVPEKQTAHADLVHDLKALGLVTNAQAVQEAVCTLYPNGLDGLDPDEVVTRLFQHLYGKKK